MGKPCLSLAACHTRPPSYGQAVPVACARLQELEALRELARVAALRLAAEQSLSMTCAGRLPAASLLHTPPYVFRDKQSACACCTYIQRAPVCACGSAALGSNVVTGACSHHTSSMLMKSMSAGARCGRLNRMLDAGPN